MERWGSAADPPNGHADTAPDDEGDLVLRAETNATSAVVTLSVAVAVIGHVLAGGAVALSVVPELVALAAACWLIGEHLAGRRLLSVAVLAGVQLAVHLTLDATHQSAAPAVMDHSHAHGMSMAMPMPMATEQPSQVHEGLSGALTMTAAHLFVLLLGVVLIDHTNQWAQRVLRILARLVPQLPAAVIPVPAVARAVSGVPEHPHLTQRWLTSSVSRRGPPAVRVLTTSS